MNDDEARVDVRIGNLEWSVAARDAKVLVATLNALTQVDPPMAVPMVVIEIVDVTPHRVIHAIKAVRQVTALSLQEAKTLVDSRPSKLPPFRQEDVPTVVAALDEAGVVYRGVSIAHDVVRRLGALGRAHEVIEEARLASGL